MSIYDKYKKAGLIPFSFSIDEDKNGSKKLLNLPSHININKYDKAYIDKRKNGLGIRTGTKQKNNMFVIGFDVDKKDNKDGVKNGLTKWNELLKEHKFKSPDSINTPTQKTGNNGYHYLFLVTDDQLKIIGSSITDLIIDGIKYSIDVKASNQLLICEPSIYKGKFYKWLDDKTPSDIDILKMPSWIYDIIFKYRQNQNKENKLQEPQKTKDKKDKLQEPIKEIIYNDTNDAYIKYEPLLKCLNIARYDDLKNWVELGHIFFSLGVPFSYWDEMSKTSAKYREGECAKKWAKLKYNANSEKRLNWYARLDNPEKYNELKKTDNLKSLFNIASYNQIKINNKYLLNNENKLNDNNDILTNNINKFYNDDNIKSLVIKSCYGSGKTQLLKEYFTKYNPSRVLWLSYRVTYTDNIMDEFKNYGFQSYLNNDYDADKLILQLESLNNLKLSNIFEDEDAEDYNIIETVPKYDIIILDEIESLLKQFDSDKTFKNKNKETFDYLMNIINVSNKVICLDGDINERALKYLSFFGEYIFINNEYNYNERVFNFVSSDKKFEDELLEEVETVYNYNNVIRKSVKQNNDINIKLKELQQNKILLNNQLKAEKNKDNINDINDKLNILETEINETIKLINDLYDKKHISICSMSKTKSIIYKNLLENKFNDIKILLINGDTGDDEKKLLKEVNINIIHYDVFIYSPSVEAGVNITIPFEKLFCILSDGSVSQRSFLQMTARIRHLNNCNITLLNDSFKLNNCFSFWTFEELKECYKNNINYLSETQNILKNGIIETKYIMTNFDIIKIFNKQEMLNTHKFYFFQILLKMLDNKGIKYTIDNIKDAPNKKIDKSFIYEQLLNAPDIDQLTLSNIKTKKNKRIASGGDNKQLDKFFLKQALGVDVLDIDIIKEFNDKQLNILRYTHLIDINNIDKKNENYKTELRKALIINSFISGLGFSNIFDDKQLNENEYNDNIKTLLDNNDIFNNTNDIKSLFNMSKIKADLRTNKAVLGYINTILNNYFIKISSVRKRNNEGEMTNNYIIEHLNNIQEIIKYRQDRHIKIYDSSNMFKYDEETFIYKHLITKTEKIININDKDAKQDINIFNNLDFDIQFNDE